MIKCDTAVVVESCARLFVVDSCAVFCAGLRQALRCANDLALVGEAATVAEALERCAALRPTLALVDVYIGGDSGIELCRQLTQRSGINVLILSAFDWDLYLAGAREAGARGFVLKSAPAGELVDALRQAQQRPLYTPEQNERIEVWRQQVSAPLSRLGGREREVLRLLATGAHNVEISAALGVTVHTIEKHVSALFRKLEVRSRTELVAWILKHRLCLINNTGPSGGHCDWWIPEWADDPTPC